MRVSAIAEARVGFPARAQRNVVVSKPHIEGGCVQAPRIGIARCNGAPGQARIADATANGRCSLKADPPPLI